ncbi:hypothetical protein [Maritimibacter sp. UBA3975]|uniref:hypothetical protein n=1 Tax=Maritimibacter sp. UBA3975 TaxID=1946833 RepID=UPI000C094E60|nr:hypothetical protein [Maritimibacter sp. UBA3975]MAM60821.1 hypothetical protein [Maritimibacter sp.]|tara:strand:+ start:10942 stop:11223 length:282 start_codon:yes stop_codon:yes gene_type:complete
MSDYDDKMNMSGMHDDLHKVDTSKEAVERLADETICWEAADTLRALLAARERDAEVIEGVINEAVSMADGRDEGDYIEKRLRRAALSARKDAK